jgi:ATP-binding cassette subfamily B protein
MIRDAVDAVAAGAVGGAGKAAERLRRSVGLMALLAVLHAFFRYLSRRSLLVAAREVEKEVRRRLFSHVIRLPLPFFHGTPTGDVLSRLTNDLSAVWLLLGPGVLMLAGTCITWLIAIAFMLEISPALTGLSLLVAPPVVLLSRGYGRSFHRQHREIQESLAAMNGTLQENVAGIRLVKAFSLEKREEERFGAICRDYCRRSLAVARTSAKFHGAIGFLAGAGVALVLYFGGRAVIRGGLTLGGFVAFNAYLAMLAFPTMAMGWVINLFQRGNAAMGRINEYFRLPAELPEDDPGPQPVEPSPPPVSPSPPPRPLLEVKGLSFSYEGGVSVLRDVSFALAKGEVAGLVGPTGCGKSTLLSLLAGLHAAPPGTIFWEGRDAAEIPLAERRARVARVSQDPFLFSDTILENICFGLEAPDPAAAREAARAALLLDEIGEMPRGIETVVGERGISLSGGQRQRATIARALCGPRPVLLLDDALSAVDSETERGIYEGILEARGEAAVLFSTHRMASLSRCDRILVLEEGRIVEDGSHDRLLSLRGRYFDLYSRQMLARELEEAT